MTPPSNRTPHRRPHSPAGRHPGAQPHTPASLASTATAPDRGSVMLCPGQGAYLPGALTAVQHIPEVATVLAAVDAVLPPTAHPVTRLLTDSGAPQPADLLARDPLAFDLVTYAGVVACGNALRHHFRCRPQQIMGHSVGDIAALAIAEAITPQAGARILHTRHTLLQHPNSPPALHAAGMLAIALPVAEVVALLAATGLHHTCIAGDNAPQQTVVSGPLNELDILHTLVRTAGIRCVRLPSRTGYHHPLLSPIEEILHAHLNTVDIQIPTVPLYSSTLAAPVRTKAEARQLAGHHLTLPVRFQASLHNLYRQDIEVFIDTGPGALLSPLVRTTLPAATTLAPLRGHADPRLVERRLVERRLITNAPPRTVL